MMALRAALVGGTAAGPAVERRGRWTPQRFGQKGLVRLGQGLAPHIGGRLSALMRRLVLAKPALHIDAINGIVDAMLDVPGIGDRGLLSIFIG